MLNYARYRDWHMWIGLILLVPMSVIATTGLLWNHEKLLGLKREAAQEPKRGQRPMDNSAGGLVDESLPAVALVAAPGAWSDHSAAIDAALAESRRQWGDDVRLERIELRDEPGVGVVVKVKAPEEAGFRPYEIVWSASAGRVLERKGDPRDGTDWAKVVHDLHTGKFFSKSYGFLWSDSGALAILALAVTGIVLYSIPMLKKRAKRRQKAAPRQTPAGVSAASAARPALAAPALPQADDR